MGTLTKINESKIKGIWQKDELENMITYENLKALSEFNIKKWSPWSFIIYNNKDWIIITLL